MLTPQILERRKSSRFIPSKPITVRPLIPDSWSSTLVSLSEQGFSFTAPFNPPIGSYIPFHVVFTDAEPLELDVRLAWKKINSSAIKKGYDLGFAVMDRKDAPVFRQKVSSFQNHRTLERRAETPRRHTSTPIELENKRVFERRGMENILSRTYVKNFGLDRWGSYYAYERVIKSSVGKSVVTDKKPVLMFGSNNYLGLTNHPRVMEATTAAIAKYGTGAGGARVLNGTTEVHRRLEEKIAQFKGTEAALVFSTGYLANISVLTSFIQRGDVVLNDQLNHASIIDGCRLTDGTVRFYRHNDMVSLEKKLRQYSREIPKLIITDGVFSMDGDIAKLDTITLLAKQNNAIVMVDDAHALGVIGPEGRGTAAHFGLSVGVDISIATFSKALGTMGGAVCGSKSLIKYLNHHSRQFIFSTAIVPSACATALAALEVMETEPEWVERLHKNRRFMIDGLKTLGFRVQEVVTAIIPVFIGDERKTYALTHLLEEMGVFVNAVSRPSVPRELSRIRVTPMATHTETDLSEALDAFKTAGKKLGII